MVESLIPPDVGKKENEKKSRKWKSQGGYVMSAVSITELKLLLMMLWLPTALKLFLLPTLLHSVVTDAKKRFARSLQIQCLEILMTFSYEGRSTGCLGKEAANPLLFLSLNSQNMCTTIHFVHVFQEKEIYGLNYPLN